MISSALCFNENTDSLGNREHQALTDNIGVDRRWKQDPNRKVDCHDLRSSLQPLWWPCSSEAWAGLGLESPLVSEVASRVGLDGRVIAALTECCSSGCHRLCSFLICFFFFLDWATTVQRQVGMCELAARTQSGWAHCFQLPFSPACGTTMLWVCPGSQSSSPRCGVMCVYIPFSEVCSPCGLRTAKILTLGWAG